MGILRAGVRPTAGLTMILSVLLLMPVGSADYLMNGYDAERTGNSPDRAPAWGDVAYRIPLPGTSAYLSGPVIIDGQAFILAPSTDPEDVSGLWRIDLDTGNKGDGPIVELGRIHTFDNPAYVSDGSHILLARTGFIEMYDLDGRLLESEPLDPMFVSTTSALACFNPLWDGARAYFPCNEFALRENAEGEREIAGAVGAIIAVDPTTFAVDVWLLEASFQAAHPGISVPRTCQAPVDPLLCPQLEAELAYGVTAADDLITATTAIGGHFSEVDPTGFVPGGTAYTDQRVVAFDKATGDVAWAKPLNADPDANAGETVQTVPSPLHVYDDGVVSFIFQDLFHLNAADGSTARTPTFLGTGDPGGRDFGGILASDGTRFYAASHHFVRSFDAQWEPGPSQPLPREEATTGLSPMIIADGMLFVQSDEGQRTGIGTEGRVLANHSSVHAFDTATMDPLWTVTVDVEMDLPLSASSFALADGLIVQVTRDGLVTVIGETSSSMAARADPSTAYPAAGDEVSVDMSMSEAGIDGPATWYKADWGDGSTPTESTTPILTHAYTEDGDYLARFEVGNDAGQTSSTTMTFHVGADPPVQPGFIQRLVSTEGIERILLIAALGLVGIVVVAEGSRLAYRRRQRTAEGREDRELAYRRALSREIELGTDPTEIAERLQPMRSVLGITDKEHARLEAEARSLRAAANGGPRLLVPGERFLDRYEVQRKLGAGGAGVTYLCHDDRLDRTVVLKVLRTDGEDATRAALAEARAFAAVHHDRVVTIYDVERLGDDVYLVLEFVDGPSLAGQISRGPLPWDAAQRLAEDLFSALQGVHRAGLVHRDVKPANLLTTKDGSYKLGDFGLASPGAADETFVGLGGGTAKYMAPEQARGERVDARADLYAAGLTLWEALTGRPYTGSTGRKTRMPARVPGGPAMNAFFERALAPDPSDRFQDAGAMGKALGRAFEDT